MVIVRSSESPLGVTLAGVAALIALGAAGAWGAVAAGGPEGPGVAGAVCTGRLICGDGTGGFGPKYFAQIRITSMESRDATRIRNSGVNLSFCPGRFKNAPHGGLPQSFLHPSKTSPLAVLSLSSSLEPGRSQTCAKADGSAGAASIQAILRGSRRTVQWPHRHSANTSVRTGSSLQTELTNRFCRSAARAARPSRPHAPSHL